MDLPQLKDFTTLAQAVQVQKEVKSLLLDLLEHPDQRNTLKVLHDKPEVWRMRLQLGEVRTYIHGIFVCDDPFMHFHPWRSSVELIQGSYNNRLGSYGGKLSDIMAAAQQGRIDELSQDIPFITTHLTPGSSYFMLDPRNIHGVQVTSGMSVSLMNTGVPYRKGATKDLSRKIPDSNPELINREKDRLISATYDYIKAYQKTQHENTINGLLQDIHELDELA